MSDEIISARLDLIAAKAKILSSKYKNNQLWGGELTHGLEEILIEIAALKSSAEHKSL